MGEFSWDDNSWSLLFVVRSLFTICSLLFTSLLPVLPLVVVHLLLVVVVVEVS